MVSELYKMRASRDMGTIDAVVSQSPLIIEGDNPRLDEGFCLQIAETYRTNFYRQDMKEHGQPYSAPTIKIHAAPGTQPALEDNVGHLWRDWLNRNITDAEAIAEKYRIATPRRKPYIVASIIVGTGALGYELLTPDDSNYGFIIGLVFAFGMFFFEKLLANRVTKDPKIGELDMYKALLNTRMRVK